MAPALVDEASSVVPIPLGRSGPRPPAIDPQGNPRTEPGGFAEADHVFVGISSPSWPHAIAIRPRDWGSSPKGSISAYRAKTWSPTSTRLGTGLAL